LPTFLLVLLFGAVTSLPVAAIYYFGSESLGLPFVPFDIFDWLARMLPGGLVTIAIDAIVTLVRGLNLGATDETAKAIEQALAIGLFAGLGALLALAVAVLKQRLRWPDSVAGGVPGLAVGVLIAAIEAAHGFALDAFILLIWFLPPPLIWGMMLGGWVSRLLQPSVPYGEQGSRRRFMVRTLGGALAFALAFWGFGFLTRQQRVSTGGDEPLPQALPVTSPEPVGRPEPVPGTRPEVTANERFYRIDINLRPLFINRDSWQLQVDGLFANPRPLTLADLMAFPAVAEPRTLSCISNPIGGDLIGNAYWTGLRLRDLMENLGLRPEARELYVESGDGFHESVTMADLLDPRTLLVYGMNGRTLPVEHGFPLRVLIPNRYGMKQPKWITRIEASDRLREGYWVVRGWSATAHPQIISMIDSVATAAASGGTVPVGGIAWAGGRGIERVEVQVDSGPWQAASLRQPPLGPLAWVQWRYDWAPPASGRYTLRVRAVDGAGSVQSEGPAPPHPDGAMGYHQVTTSI
jgi:DMSO/TMAO reductase YedYZ molybdopterin-dependent catalytic subunit